jgi:hypothetical protein
MADNPQSGSPVTPDEDTPAQLLTMTVKSAPNLGQAPGTALDVAQAGGNITQNAQSVGTVGKLSDYASAAQNEARNGGGGGWLDDAFHDIGKVAVSGTEDAVKAVSTVANAPLHQVQHLWRYLVDVEARHGMFAAVAEGLGILGAGVAASVLTGGLADEAGEAALSADAITSASDVAASTGTETAADSGASSLARTIGKKVITGGAGKYSTNVLAGEAAGTGMGQVLFHDSWDRTNSDKYVNPGTGQPVSFGRSIASGLFRLSPQSGTYKFLSGVGDGVFDLFSDPLQNAAELSTAAHGLEASTVLGRRFEGTSVLAEDTEQQYKQYASIRRAVDNIASMKTPGEVRQQFPLMAPIAAQLAQADTASDVMDIFKDKTKLGELQGAAMPSQSMLRVPFSRVYEAMGNADTNHAGGLINPANWGGKFNLATTRIPGFDIDPESGQIQGKLHFEDLAPVVKDGKLVTQGRTAQGVNDLFLWARRTGFKNRDAQQVVDMWYQGDAASRSNIFRNLIQQSILQRAGKEYASDSNTLLQRLQDPERTGEIMDALNDAGMRTATRDAIDKQTVMYQPGTGGVFNSNLDGSALDLINPETGAKSSGALYPDQLGEGHIPSLDEINTMARKLSGVRNWVGSIDQFAYDHVTTPFKGLVLTTGTYPLHIAGAEIIPFLLRYGPRKFINNGLLYATARLGLKVERGEAGPIAEKLDQWGQAFRKLQDPKKIGWAFEAAQDAADSDSRAWQQHGGGGDNKDISNVVRGGTAHLKPDPTGAHGLFGPTDTGHTTAWAKWLDKLGNREWAKVAARSLKDSADRGLSEAQANMAAQSAVEQALNDTPQANRDLFHRSRFKTESASPLETPKQDWAANIVADVKAATHSARTHEPIEGLLDDVIGGTKASESKLQDIPAEDKPRRVPGQLLVEDHSNLIQRIVNFNMKRVANPIISELSRDPAYMTTYFKHRAITSALEEKGIYTTDEARLVARQQATYEMTRYVHNIHDRTNLDQMVRNIIPFAFAQEQAYRRMGRLLASDPAAFRKYQLMIQSIGHYAQTVQDGNGNQYVSYPGSGFINDAIVHMFNVLHMPMGSVISAGFGGTLTSTNVIFPLSNGPRPNLGPLAIIPAQAGAAIFAEMGREYANWRPLSNDAQGALDFAVGTSNMSAPVLEQLVPNQTAYRMVEAIQGDDTSFNSAMMDAMAGLEYQQNLAMANWRKDGSKGAMPTIFPPPTATPMQQQDFIDKVRNQTRALFVTRAILGNVTPLNADVVVNDFGLPEALQNDINRTGSYAAGVQEFLAKNPYATPFTTSHSTTATGFAIPETSAAMDWINQNNSLISQYEYGAFWLMPQADTKGKYSAQVYQEQIADGLRTRDTPTQFLTSLYNEAGDAVFYPALTQHEDALQQAGHNTSAISEEYNKWDAFTQEMQAQMPVWASQQDQNQRLYNASQSISQLTEIYQNNLQGTGTQAQLVGQLLQTYQEASAKYTQAGMSNDYSTAQKTVTDEYENTVEGMAQANPQLAPVVKSVFRDALTSAFQQLGS